jgi:hypothetical protein
MCGIDEVTECLPSFIVKYNKRGRIEQFFAMREKASNATAIPIDTQNQPRYTDDTFAVQPDWGHSTNAGTGLLSSTSAHKTRAELARGLVTQAICYASIAPQRRPAEFAAPTSATNFAETFH